MEDMVIGFDEITEAFPEMIEVWPNTESDEERWPQVDGVDRAGLAVARRGPELRGVFAF